jgi:steroid 5-alpha reductase family enzyme
LFARVVKEGKDSRFDGTRDNFFKFAAFWIAQMITVWSICIPQTLMSSVPVSPALGWQDGLGIAIWAVGFIIEAVSDQQKFAFKNSSPENRKRMMMGGLWSVSRHPNYFGECLCWWGIWSIATSTFFVNPVMYVSILSPVYVGVILLFLSGIPTLEKPWDQKYGKDADYRAYKMSVPPFVLFIPALYKRFPYAAKLIFCCEFPFYSTDFPGELHPLQRDGESGDVEQQFESTEKPVAKGYQ